MSVFVDWVETLGRLSIVETLVLISYFGVLAILAIYGLHRSFLVRLYLKNRRRPPGPAEIDDADLPRVTVQVPVFNEKDVIERVLDAVCALDYPFDRLEIQVLDDSTDETTDLIARRLPELRKRGLRILHLRRLNRSGYKAGALAEGLSRAWGELVAIFDADFVPAPSTLRRLVPYFSNPGVGMVQARWGHLNRDGSLLTRIQAMLLDAHFVLESGARFRGGLFFNFNGTAGIWRVRAIEEAGGWQSDTLTEDLDLSYRAQLKGWRFVFVPELEVPAELPNHMTAFKSQQFRWVKGTVQTARKILPQVLRSSLPARLKMEAFFHLTGYLTQPLMLVLALLTWPSFALRIHRGWLDFLLVDALLFAAATGSVTLFYAVSQRELYRDWIPRLSLIPAVMATGIGLSVSNTRAFIEAILSLPSPFSRTPKSGAVGREGRRSSYGLLPGLLPSFELALAFYFLAMILSTVSNGAVASLPYLLLFLAGYLYVGASSVLARVSPMALVYRQRNSAVSIPPR